MMGRGRAYRGWGEDERMLWRMGEELGECGGGRRGRPRPQALGVARRLPPCQRGRRTLARPDAPQRASSRPLPPTVGRAGGTAASEPILGKSSATEEAGNASGDTPGPTSLQLSVCNTWGGEIPRLCTSAGVVEPLGVVNCMVGPEGPAMSG